MKRSLITELENKIEKEVLVSGWIYRVRDLKTITFIVLRDRTGYLQCVVENKILEGIELKLESAITLKGTIKDGNNKYSIFELHVKELEILNPFIGELPIELNKESLDINLDTKLNNRVLSLRHKEINSIFKLQNIIVASFREYLIQNGFREIFTPKIVKEGAEGGTDMFEVKYFENKAYLAQSPQFYKQMMVGAGFERVFEIGHVYRSEQHNTNRHLNEYISMDLEIGFIEDEEELMILEEELLKYILEKASEKGFNVPKIDGNIPRIEFNEAVRILRNKYNKIELEGDIDPEGEKLIYKYVKEKYNCDFVFLTNYPCKKRPMYTMPKGESGTRSFDLLFRGVEITTGGQRIHNYNMLIEGFKKKGLNPDNYESYIKVFKYGMTPHGGLAIGLERITAQLLGLENVREATLITRDRTRLIP